MVIQAPVILADSPTTYYSFEPDFGNRNGETFVGPVERLNGDLYLAGWDTVSDLLVVLKSTDGGSAWAKQDVAHQPTLYPGGLDIVAVVNTLHILYCPAIDSLAIQQFDMATDTFGAASPTKSNSSSFFASTCRLARVSSGDLYAFWNEADASFLTNPIKYAVYNGASWGSTQTIITAANKNYGLRGAIADASDLIHIVFQDGASSISTSRILTYRSLTTGGTVSASTVIENVSRNADWLVGRLAIWIPVADPILVVPTPRMTAPFDKSSVYLGTHLAGPISFDPLVQLNTSIGSTADAYMYAVLSANHTTVYVFWASRLNDGGSQIDALYYSSNNGGGWSAPVLFYDAVANPPTSTPTADLQLVHRISAAKLASGRFGVTINLESTLFGDTCIAFYLIDAPDVPVLSIICDNPPAGRVGVFYSHAFPASGGTPPYTFSIIGTLPPGLALNTLTGVVSGVPTTVGTWAFTVKVASS